MSSSNPPSGSASPHIGEAVSPPGEVRRLSGGRGLLAPYRDELFHAAAHRWNRFWFTPEDPATLGLIRLLTGLMLVYTHWVWGLDFESFFGPESWVTSELVQQFQRDDYVFSLWYVVPERSAFAVHLVCVGVLGLFALGLFTRVTSLLALVIVISYASRVPTALFGLDQINGVLTFYLALGPSGAAYSLDAWLRRRASVQVAEGQRGERTESNSQQPQVSGSVAEWQSGKGETANSQQPTANSEHPTSNVEHPTPNIQHPTSNIQHPTPNTQHPTSKIEHPTPNIEHSTSAGFGFDAIGPSIHANLAIRLIQVHMCVIYLFAGLSKLQGPAWWDGMAMWLAFANQEYQTLDMLWLAEYPLLINLLTHFTVFWEVTYSVFVWRPLLRPIVLFFAVVLHVGIGLCMGMWTFGLIMIIGNLAFVPPHVIRRALTRRHRVRSFEH